jgi:hypothetical protein
LSHELATQSERTGQPQSDLEPTDRLGEGDRRAEAELELKTTPGGVASIARSRATRAAEPAETGRLASANIGRRLSTVIVDTPVDCQR